MTTDTTTVKNDAPAVWHAGLDAETLGHVQTKGWDKLDPAAAAVAIVKAHREAERYIGAPADQLIRLPKDPKDEAGWNAVYQRLGAPADAKEYDFKDVKFSDGTEPDAAFLDNLRATAAANHLSKDAARALATNVIKYMDDAEKAELAEYTAKIQGERDTLIKNWGANAEANFVIAKGAARKLGVSDEQIQTLEKTVGYAKTMDLFLSIGQKIGEDVFVSNPAGGATTGVLTREQAMTRKAELMADKAWAKRYMDGGAQEAREMTALLSIITGDDTEQSLRRVGGR